MARFWLVTSTSTVQLSFWIIIIFYFACFLFLLSICTNWLSTERTRWNAKNVCKFYKQYILVCHTENFIKIDKSLLSVKLRFNPIWPGGGAKPPSGFLKNLFFLLISLVRGWLTFNICLFRSIFGGPSKNFAADFPL